MRVIVSGLFHEANAFSPVNTPMSSFHTVPKIGLSKSELKKGEWLGYADFIEAVESTGDVPLPCFYAYAQPSAPANSGTYNALLNQLLQSVEDAGQCDAVLLFLHGAQTAENDLDCAGQITSKIRNLVGNKVAIGVVLDLHANVSELLLNSATILACCKEYPHTDFGIVCHKIWKILKDRPNKITYSWCRAPIFPAATTVDGPMREFVDKMCQIEASHNILSVSAAHAFPHANVKHANAGILVYATEQDLSDKTSRQLAKDFYYHAKQACASSPGLNMEKTVESVCEFYNKKNKLLAHNSVKLPLIVAERSDNPGAGGSSDSTHLLLKLKNIKIKGVGVALIHDPETVKQAFEIGKGNYGHFQIGGKSNTLAGEPLEVYAKVVSVRDNATQSMFGDSGQTTLGLSVGLVSEHFSFIVNTVRQQPFSSDLFKEHNINISKQNILVLKSTNHFYKSFAPLASKVIYCDGIGAASEDLAALPYTSLSRPTWPLDSDEDCMKSFM